jgi:hypothetical protein
VGKFHLPYARLNGSSVGFGGWLFKRNLWEIGIRYFSCKQKQLSGFKNLTAVLLYRFIINPLKSLLFQSITNTTVRSELMSLRLD